MPLRFARCRVSALAFEVGPVTLDRNVAARPMRRVEGQEAFWIDDDLDSISLADCNRRLGDVSDLAVPVIVRVKYQDSRQLIRELAPGVRFVSLEIPDGEEWVSYLRDVLAEAKYGRSLLLSIPADKDLEYPLIDIALQEGVGGIIVDGSMRAKPDGRIVGLLFANWLCSRLRSFANVTE